MPKIDLNQQQKAELKILVIGAVAGGGTFSARARRLSEEAEIIMVDRGPYVSFANCGLPYYIGEVIPEEENLLMVTREEFRDKFNIDVRLYTEAIGVDAKNKKVTFREVLTGKEYEETYDKLVLAAGSQPFKPPLPGIDLPGIYTLRNIPDANIIKSSITDNKVKDAVVVGGGLIGLEMTENLTALGINVTIVEMLPNVIPFFDPEMASPVHTVLKKKGVNLCLNTAVKSFSRDNNDGKITVETDPGRNLSCDMVILSIGSRPEISLAQQAGLEIGKRGGVRVNEQMQTSNEDIYAVGDMVESKDVITGEWLLSLLASPANRQARIAADAIFGRNRSFRGVQQTAVCRIFDIDIASTGASEKSLKRAADNGNVIPYEKVYLLPKHHADYYPGAEMMMLKLIFSNEDGKVLGAQISGGEGVEKRIDVIAMAIQMGATVYDLEEAELCYAPQFGSAKDAVNMAGMTAANILRGDIPTVHWNDIDTEKIFLIDPRGKDDYDAGHVEGAVNIPLEIIRESMNTLDPEKELYISCTQGKLSYYMCRALLLNGFNCTNVSGGFKTYQAYRQIEKKLSEIA
ncbi:MAG: FAD-dependent oxidoreductase [Dehalococcoidales bacterium]|nr:FAD-dependent oxidoreductase [Dehalococcoidales bacterium]